ncbi:hypothetical protein BLA24_05725 [Streptomyces cinnamoneus]|uniref:DUF4437 domain-containing protein n=1 Tax=Streptomyces cinnamoneus TaxID=53446 RepID=A0A2G1XND3_STRCJ|nr:hypothetical protein [Streptomyces cinnamoneus]PHQ52764.1 hypothetical protein BLA24_05725 [Streptomyces cinnamoneus]PPT11865.1 hypothetical protein CYQ11_02200 [Streptomyces cinnamoneus]
MPRARHALAAATALTLCASAALTLGATTPATAGPAHVAGKAADEPSLTGFGKLKREPGDNPYFAVDARGFGDKAHGDFYVSHHVGKEWGGHFKGRVDCLLTGGPVAVVTGVVTESEFKGAPGMPDVGDLKGKRFGFTVMDDGKHDRVGYSWAMDGMPKNSVGKCVSSAPFETLEKGDYSVHHWMPPRQSAKP